jgi:TolB-like protein
MSFIAELKRRNVVRVGIAYGVIGWVLAQIAEFAFDNFGAPDWVLKSFVALLLLGLPVALIFAWAFEMPPEGLKRERDVNRSQSITAQTGRKLNTLIISVLIIAVGILVWDKFTGGQAGKEIAATAEQSIAVLPFTNMSDDSDHFADGLTEELLNLLAQNRDLKVAGRTSSFAFKGRNEDLREIGDALGVSKVLEGSVRRSGERIRVTAQLIQVEDGFHLWSDTYDRELADIFDIQDEVAGAITQALQLHLTPAAKRLTDNPDAYAHYLEAIALSSIDHVDDISNAIRLLDRATTLDPMFAKAYELKAMFHWMNAGWGVPVSVGQAAVYEAASRALEIDPTLPGAKSLAITSHPTEWDWIVELDALEALTAVDKSVRALDTYGLDLNVAGYFTEAEQKFRQVIEKDPLSSSAWWRLAEALSAQGRVEESKEAARKSVSLDPEPWNAGRHILLTHAIIEGDDDEAIRIATPAFDKDFFGYPDAASFLTAMRHPDTGRDALQAWVQDQISKAKITNDVVQAMAYYLNFGYIDLYIDAIDSFGPPAKEWSDVEVLEMFGQNYPATGYRQTKHYLERAEGNGLIELWEHRGPPDNCSKETDEWVCE